MVLQYGEQLEDDQKIYCLYLFTSGVIDIDGKYEGREKAQKRLKEPIMVDFFFKNLLTG